MTKKHVGKKFDLKGPKGGEKCTYLPKKMFHQREGKNVRLERRSVFGKAIKPRLF